MREARRTFAWKSAVLPALWMAKQHSFTVVWPMMQSFRITSANGLFASSCAAAASAEGEAGDGDAMGNVRAWQAYHR